LPFFPFLQRINIAIVAITVKTAITPTNPRAHDAPRKREKPATALANTTGKAKREAKNAAKPGPVDEK